MEEQKEYYAFISYKREDKKEAKRLQHALEYYRLPNNLRQENPELPEYVRPVFRDMTDLEVGELSAQIHAGLEQSHFLIVVCSPRAAASKWVNDEVEYFISLGKQDKIIPYIIEGVPHANNPNEECYPPSLLNLSKEKELLGANINEVGKDSATIRVVSRMFDIRFDTLYQRYEREQKKHRRQLTTVIILAFLFLFGIAGWIWHQNVLLKEREWKMMENQARAVAEKASALVVDGDTYLAQLLALEVLPQDLCYPIRPYSIEAENALRHAECGSISTLEQGWTAQLSPLGFKIVSLNGILWNIDNGKIVKEARGVNTILSPDSKRIIFTIPNDSICIWDLETSKCIRCFYCPNSAYSIAISPDGSKIAAASRNVSLIDSENGSIIWSVDGLKHSLFEETGTAISNISFSEDGKYIVCVNHLMKIFDAKNGKCVNSFSDKNRFYSASLSPNSKNVVFPAGNKVKICDTFSGKCILSTDSILAPDGDNLFTDEKTFQASLNYSHDGNYFVLASGHELSIWDARKGVCVKKKKCDDEWFKDAAFSPDGLKILYTHIDDSGASLKIWDIASEPSLPLKIVKTSELPVMAGFDLRGDNILIALKNCLVLWDAEMRTSRILSNNHTKQIRYASFSPDSKRIVTVSDDNHIKIIDALSGDCLHKIRIEEDVNPYTEKPYVVNFNNIGNQMMFVASHQIAKIWDAKSWKCIMTIPNVDLACYSQDGKYLVTLMNDGYLKVWDSRTFNCTATSGKNDNINCITISQNGKKIVTATDDCIFDIWDLQTCKHINRIVAEKTEESFHDKILSLSLSPDEKQIVAISCWPIAVWDVKSGKCISTLGGKYAPGNKFATFSLDGRRAIAVGDGEFIRLWRYPNLQQLINETREALKDRQLSPEERQKYYLK